MAAGRPEDLPRPAFRLLRKGLGDDGGARTQGTDRLQKWRRKKDTYRTDPSRPYSVQLVIRLRLVSLVTSNAIARIRLPVAKPEGHRLYSRTGIGLVCPRQ